MRLVRRLHVVVLTSLLALTSFDVAFAQALSDADIHRILVERIDRGHDSVGIVVGIVEPGRQRIISHGTFAIRQGTSDARNVDGDTLYEIGSVTKVFTSLILADMVRRQEVKLDDPVAKYLPDHVKVPSRGGRQITLVDLATHRSGLPRMPSNYSENGPDDPHAVYSEDQLYAFLSSYQLERDIGAQFDYSNVGVALLGLALSRRAGVEYGVLVRERVLAPLGMTSTGFPVRPEHRERLATGHTNQYWMTPAPEWNLTTLAAAGSLRSSAKDMLSFLAASLGMTGGSVADSLKAMLAKRYDVSDSTKIGLGWFLRTDRGTEVVFHNGGTFGYQSFVGFAPKERMGVVVLSNNGSGEGVSDIGRHILNPQLPLRRVRVPSREPVSIESQGLRAYAGRYALAEGRVWTVRADGNRLFLEKSGEPEFEIFAQGNHQFFLKTADAQVTFEFDKASPERAQELVMRQVWLNKRQRAKRVE